MNGLMEAQRSMQPRRGRGVRLSETPWVNLTRESYARSNLGSGGG
jgi:hypothetical protein